MNDNKYENRLSDMNSLELNDLKNFESLEQFKNQQKEQLDNMLKNNENRIELLEKKYNSSVIGSLMSFFCGDAKGVPYEFKNRKEIGDVPHEMIGNYGVHNQAIGTFSDDSSTVLATMDAIIEKEGIDYDQIMSNICEWYNSSKYTANNQVFDIGGTTKKAIDNYNRGKKIKECGSNKFDSNGNGSLMRMLPIALLFSSKEFSVQEEVETVYYISGLTHSHEISLAGCKIYCDIIKELADGYTMIDALDIIKDNDYDYYYEQGASCYFNILNNNITKMGVDDIKSSGYIVDTLEASIWCVLNSNSIEESIQKAIKLGGDTDTIAAITGSFSGLIYGYENIPKDWLQDLKKNDELLKISIKYLDFLNKTKKKEIDNLYKTK